MDQVNMGELVLTTLIISLSGVMAPGPVTAVTIGKGARSPHAGAFLAVGHGIFEIPLMVVLLAGLGTIARYPLFGTVVGSVGGLFLVYLGVDMARNFRKPTDLAGSGGTRGALVSGILLSAGNPYFLLWWATTGLTLISRSKALGVGGFVVFAVVHWLCDFGWLYLLSTLSYRGSKFFGGRLQQAVFFVCGVALLVFGFLFAYDGVKSMIHLT